MLFEDLVVDLIMEGGDADTIGAVAGAMLGAYLGYASLPAHWALGMRHREWLMGKIGRLCVTVGIVDGELQSEADEGVDGGKGPWVERGDEEGEGFDSNQDGEDDNRTTTEDRYATGYERRDDSVAVQEPELSAQATSGSASLRAPK